jgi:GT2 family glycosyltransferase
MSNPPIYQFKHINDIIARIKLEGHLVQFIPNDIRNGIAYARNRALYADRWNDLIVRIDDDSYCEPDYLERLVRLYEEKTNEGIKVGGVGGIVPPLGAPEFIRDGGKIARFNRVEISDKEVDVGDDGGYYYSPNAKVESDHLRSSFLFSKKAALEIGGNALETGSIGWREETIFCMKMKWLGYSLFTDTAAICWHLAAPYGGRNRAAPEQHALVEDYFKRWAKREYERHGKTY